MSDDAIYVTINGEDSAQKVVDSIMTLVKTAGADGTSYAATEHQRIAIDNVKNAYTSAGYPKISGMYARWLAARSPEFRRLNPQFDAFSMDDKSDDWVTISDSVLDAIARQILNGKTSMVSGLSKPGTSLLEGIKIYDIEHTRTSVTRTVVSEAIYSNDLERGYLFGKYRGENKRRPFFTGHTGLTRLNMVRRFKQTLELLQR